MAQRTYLDHALQVLKKGGSADAAFSLIMKGQHTAVAKREQKKKWSNEKKTARRKGTW